MQLRIACEREWVERPQGWMGRRELCQFVDRLRRIPPETAFLHIEWDAVTHLDFRGLAGLAAEIRRITAQGIGVRNSGFSPYLTAILRFALSFEEIEMFEDRGDARRTDRIRGSSVEDWLPGLLASIHLAAN